MIGALWWGASALWAGAATIAVGSGISSDWARSHTLGRAMMLLLAAAVTLTLIAWSRRRLVQIEVAYDLGEMAGMHKAPHVHDHGDRSRRVNR